VILKVGEQHFNTFRDTLTGESKYFAARFLGSWNDTDKDGSYFIDTDPDIFKYVLNYLRDGSLPLFFNAATKEFNYEKYTALLGQAKYFGIAKLENWIEKERYLAAAKTEYTSTMISGDNLNAEISYHFDTVKGNATLDLSYGWGTKKVYVCPRAIPVHRGQPDLCGAKCHKAQIGERRNFEDEPVLKVFVIRSEVIFDPKVCMGGGLEE
ncbi:BTB/POZ protein, partial [Pseudomassariella vexata]